MALLSLCPEVQENIWRFCSPGDLINLACCSKLAQEIANPFIWRAVSIQWKALESRSLVKKKTRHLKYTSHLRINFNEQCDNDLMQSCRSNLDYVVENCDEKKIIAVTVYGCMDYMNFDNYGWLCDRLPSFKQLTKVTFREAVFSQGNIKLGGLPNLEELVIIKCEFFFDALIDDLFEVGLPKLRKLTFRYPDWFVMRNAAEVISVYFPKLVELSLPWFESLQADHLEPVFQSLEDLQVLNLYACDKSEEVLRRMAATTKNLRVLDLGLSRCTFKEELDCIADIHSLKSLSLEFNLLFLDVEKEFRLPPFLEKLHLCHILGLRDEHIAWFVKYQSLKFVDLSHCSDLTEKGLEYLMTSDSLQRLNLRGLHYDFPNSVVEKVDRSTQELYWSMWK